MRLNPVDDYATIILMKKTTKKISPLPVKKVALKNMAVDHFGAILEDINDKFTVMVEGHNMVVERMDRMETEMRSSFKTVFEYLSRIDSEIQEIKAELSQKAQIKEVRELQSRVLKLELELMSLRNSLHPQKT